MYRYGPALNMPVYTNRCEWSANAVEVEIVVEMKCIRIHSGQMCYIRR